MRVHGRLVRRLRMGLHGPVRRELLLLPQLWLPQLWLPQLWLLLHSRLVVIQ